MSKRNPLLGSQPSVNGSYGSMHTGKEQTIFRRTKAPSQFIVDATSIWRKHRFSIVTVVALLLTAVLLFTLMPLPPEQHFKVRNVSIHAVEHWIINSQQASSPADTLCMGGAATNLTHQRQLDASATIQRLVEVTRRQESHERHAVPVGGTSGKDASEEGW